MSNTLNEMLRLSQDKRLKKISCWDATNT